MTETVPVPYRPSVNTVDCTQGQGRWYDAATDTCNNGLAFTWDFDFASSGVVLPDRVIVGVEFNTSTSGPNPIGTAGGYDWLNVALAGTVSAGALPDADPVFWDSTYLGRTPGFTPETGYAANGAVMLAISVAAPTEPTPTAPPAVLPPAPQPASPGTGVTVPSTPPTPGGVIVVQASGFLPFEDVYFVWYSTPQFGGWLRADAAGVVSGSIPVPAGLAPGAHTLQAVGAVSGTVASLPITVALSATGQTTAPIAPLAAGAASALLGAVLLGAAVLRRRRQG